LLEILKPTPQKLPDVDFATFVCEQLKAHNIRKDKTYVTRVIITNIETFGISFAVSTGKNLELNPAQPAIEAIAEKYITMV
jgi:hypothetical protein